jgi:two-component system, OmpR family, catabolic regulation response regulator CreB
VASTNTLIYVVEDELAIAEAVSFALQAEGFSCRHFATGGDCLEALRSAVPSLMLLDIGLPDISGFELFRSIREQSDAPVIFLTARKEEIDRVVGLEMGADDYVVKPFSVRELMARVRMVLRRRAVQLPTTLSTAASAGETAAQSRGSFRHHAERRQFHYAGKPLDLTLHEYRLLEVLLRHPGRVFTRAQLLEQAWDAPDHRLDRTVDSHIKSLRAKLRAIDSSADPIQTHRGTGYSLEVGA